MKKLFYVIIGLTLFFVIVAVMAHPSASDPSTPRTSVAVSIDPTLKPPTTAQDQALKSAQNYVDMEGISRAGLLRQLTSNAGEGFKTADARYAVGHVKVNWNHEAVQSAQTYMHMGGFSRTKLIEQLTSSYGEGFTQKQATYAADKVGL